MGKARGRGGCEAAGAPRLLKGSALLSTAVWRTRKRLCDLSTRLLCLLTTAAVAVLAALLACISFVRTRFLGAADPHRVLGVSRLATLQELEAAFRRLARGASRDSAALLRLNTALSDATVAVHPLLYTPAVLGTDFPLYPEDFFARLALLYGIRDAPSLASNPRAFYVFWSRFKHVDPGMDKAIHGILRLTKRIDPRVDTGEADGGVAGRRGAVARRGVTGVTGAVERRVVDRSGLPFYCVECSRGFRTANTYKDHCKSRKHVARVGAACGAGLGGEDDSSAAIESCLVSDGYSPAFSRCRSASGLTDLDLGGSASDGESFSGPERVDAPSTPLSHAQEAPPSPASQSPGAVRNEEHSAFRTCSLCKTIFKSRGRLLKHLRSGCEE